ncbi:IclR family transcriptional regulator [Enhydrobacter aerosaccus]|uniref:IclR family transcriptional regulator n=1 Tax=Enhydrobacter aerosaccus TaxID=225324 RepID=UPI001E6364D2|nr:IclR family transcriptional regulator [Enhydrobacter aerosaccus]
MLEAIAAERGSLTLTEIAARLGMSKSSVHDLLGTLSERGYVKKLGDSGYGVGMKAWEVGCLSAPIGMARTAAPHMTQLVRAVTHGVSLAVLDGAETVCIQLIEAARAVRVHNNIGDRSPAHAVSAGLAMLSTMDDEEVARLLPGRLPRITSETLTTREDLLAELGRVRRRGYSISRGAWRIDVAGIAVPVRGPDGRVAAGLAIAAPRDDVTDDWIRGAAPLLKSAARKIETDFGAPSLDGAIGRQGATR